jgi:SAM-dependent methyltransferase
MNHCRTGGLVDPKTHWNEVYSSRKSDELSWYQREPLQSLMLFAEAGLDPESSIVDIGGGDSTLVDALLERGFRRVTVLDISGAALDRARARLGARAADVTWIEADVTRADLPVNAYDAWHDRAVFHFLVDPKDRERYVLAARHALRSRAILIIATFASDGPPQCSGLTVARYDADGLALEFGAAFELLRSIREVHRTPTGSEQHFTYALLRRR